MPALWALYWPSTPSPDSPMNQPDISVRLLDTDQIQAEHLTAAGLPTQDLLQPEGEISPDPQAPEAPCPAERFSSGRESRESHLTHEADSEG